MVCNAKYTHQKAPGQYSRKVFRPLSLHKMASSSRGSIFRETRVHVEPAE